MRHGQPAMSEPRPWFPLYAGDFLHDAAVMRMTTEQVGAYLLLLAYEWINGPLPGELVALAPLVRLPVDVLETRIWPAVGPCFRRRDDGRIEQKRLELERAKAIGLSAKGSAMARRRWSAS